MSDDEGGEDYGDYEDLGEGAGDEGQPDEPAEPEAEAEAEAQGQEAEPPEDDGETGLDEEAAGTDEDDEAEEGDEAGDEGDDESVEPGGASQKAHPQRQKVDPILRASNKPREIIIVPAADRITDNRLHRSEAAALIGIRAEQIDKYATHFAQTPGNLRDAVAIAFKELFDRRCPLKLRRSIGTGPGGEDLVEEWSPQEMTLPALTPPVPLGSGAPVRAGGGSGRPAFW